MKSAALRRSVAVIAVCLGLTAALAGAVDAQTRALDLDVIYNPDTRVNFSGVPVPNIDWLDASTYVVPARAGRDVTWQKVDAASGRATPLFDAARMEAAVAALPGMARDAAARVARSSALTLNPAKTGAMFTIADDLYYYGFADNRAVRLTNTPGSEDEPMFSPDGRSVAFMRGYDLFVSDVTTGKESALTTGGSKELLNGRLDWLYQEEIYGRGRFRGYWWSPDSSRIAFLQLDEKPVPEYTVTDHIPYRPALEVTDYPKAGDPNPIVRVGIVRATGGTPQWLNLDGYAGTDILAVDIDWTPESTQVVAQIQDREQTWLDLTLGDVASGALTRVLRETTKAWVNNNGSPIWLKDGSFLWFSERSGFKHLYRYRRDGTQVAQVTSGKWDVRSFYGVDEARGRVYFAASEHAHLDTDIYRIGLDGSGLTRLSNRAGTHRAIFNPDYTQYVDVWNDAITPSQVRLHRADGTEARVIEANPVSAIAEYGLVTPEFVPVRMRDGVMTDAMLFKPKNFDPAKKYPVYQFTYAGPGAARARNQWSTSENLFHQWLAQQGVLVWVHDNRAAGGEGVESQWPIYQRLGEKELEDLEDGLAWLKQQPYVDGSHVTLFGWSYGGFMTAYALTHSTSWSAGIVGAPVTDWRDYDSIYTERLMKTPQNNPDGYRRTAPRFAADKLQGTLLLIHGTMDDNVHMQNSIQFAYELQKAGKPFEMMVYAKSRHGLPGGEDPWLNKHLRQTMFDFVMRNSGLKP